MPDGLLKYYYHFFKFIYATEVGNYNSAEKHLESASDLLDMMSDEKKKQSTIIVLRYINIIFHNLL